MKHARTVTVLALVVAILAALATVTGIFSNEGTGQYQHTSIRGTTVSIYGKGLYKHMSAEVAPQGIAQDYVTLFIGIPLLITALIFARKGSARGRYLLAGTLGYFLVTYLFYAVMAMYNAMFLAYVLIMGAAFYAFILTILTFNVNSIKSDFLLSKPLKWTGIFLIINSIAIALLWLSIVVPPLLNNTVIPPQVEHYTTLIVQGLDLGILLPGSFLSGALWIMKKPFGYVLTPVYLVFLSLLMTALTSKVLAMDSLGYNVIPVIFIIPAFNIVTIIATVSVLKNIQTHSDKT
jgi:hypothetical protein